MGFVLNERQQRTLAALCETFNPQLEPAAGDDPAFFENCASERPVVARIVALVRKLDESERSQTLKLLDKLGVPGRGWRMGGPIRSFESLSLDQRTGVVKRLLRSRDPKTKAIIRSIQRLSLQGSYVSNGANETTFDSQQEKLFKAIGYVDRNPQVPVVDHLSPSKLNPGQRQLACDYLVVGSGAAGAVMAAELAETGRRVLLVDSGDIVSRLELGQSETLANSRLESYGSFDCGSNPVLVTTAKTFGGGPVVNWGTCLDPPKRLLERWAAKFGFHDAVAPDFQHSLFTVRRRLQVSDATSRLNRQNEILQAGLQRLGWRVRVLERNAVDCQSCDRCEFGCASGARQDTRETYLMDAQRLGVYLLPRCRIERLLFDGDRAIKALASMKNEADADIELEITFREIVLCAGAIHTPAILLRSGILGPHLGKNLHLHPAAIVPAFHSQPVRGWEGAVQTIASDEWSAMDTAGYGIWLEAAPVHPGFAAMVLPWADAQQHKRLMQRIDRLSHTLVICRDRPRGRVGLDAQGRPKVFYTLDLRDELNLQDGVVAALKVQQAAGAESVFLPTWDSVEFDLRPSKNEASQDFQDQVSRLRLTGRLKLFSAHQFSTCRLASSPNLGVVDCNARLYGKRNVFITDASSLPTATGVNPMLTITTWSHFLAQKIKAVTCA
jgi:long-chain-alcohol oxidase